MKKKITDISIKAQRQRKNSNLYKDSYIQESFDFNKLFQEDKNESNKSN